MVGSHIIEPKSKQGRNLEGMYSSIQYSSMVENLVLVVVKAKK